MKIFIQRFIVSSVIFGGISLGVFAEKGFGKDGEASQEEKSAKDTTVSEVGPIDSQSAALETSDRSVRKIRLSGFTRVVGFYRNMDKYYDMAPTRGLTLPVNLGIGDGSGNPALMLRIEANPSARTSILLETALHHNFGAGGTGVYGNSITVPADGKISSVFARFALEAKTVTDYGKFHLTTGGGMNWGKISPFTMWTFQYRDDLFERYPWDPAGSNWSRYNSFYSYGDIPRDLRWGNRSTQGIRLDAEELPYGLSGTFMYGKTSVTGGYESWVTGLPQNMIAARLAKQIKAIKIGVNYYNHFGYDSTTKIIDTAFVFNNETYTVNTNKTAQTVITIDGKIKMSNGIRMYSEIGLGSYLSGEYYAEDTLRNPKKDKTNHLARTWSPMAYLEADVPKSVLGLPFKASVFAIGRNAINNSSAILNSTNENATNGRDFAGNAQQGDNVFYFEGMVTEIGQVTNNRAGGSVKTSKRFGKLSAELGIGIQQELQNLGIPDTLPSGVVFNGGRDGIRNSVTFYHIVNQYQRSRFNFINRFVGPYNRLQADFRRHWENMAITDATADIDYKKSFNTLDLQLKYKTLFLQKELILSGYGRANSVQEKVAIIPKFGSDKPFFRQWFEEFMFFYKLSPKWTLIGFTSFEQVKGNDRTELADKNGESIINPETGLPARQGDTWEIPDPSSPGLTKTYTVDGSPINQRGYGIGVGFDYDFSSRASLDVRYRWISHRDLNFTKDEFRGHDITAEMKIFF